MALKSGRAQITTLAPSAGGGCAASNTCRVQMTRTDTAATGSRRVRNTAPPRTAHSAICLPPRPGRAGRSTRRPAAARCGPGRAIRPTCRGPLSTGLQLGDPALEHGHDVGPGGVRLLVLDQLPELRDVEVAQPRAQRGDGSARHSSAAARAAGRARPPGWRCRAPLAVAAASAADPGPAAPAASVGSSRYVAGLVEVLVSVTLAAREGISAVGSGSRLRRPAGAGRWPSEPAAERSPARRGGAAPGRGGRGRRAGAVSGGCGARARGTCWLAGVLFLSLSVIRRSWPIPAKTPRSAWAGASFTRSLT